ncbi:hypothetical protein OZN62_02525 [Aurantiacibacter sp. MUD11]|uniref:hypothetical protein n=1 Tax=Aurantiacibacter sp. MUD11 TaxID=3003265 RepID=UPI0022AA21AF|nr:hypothetical protein [Aurantiacibacter sp. MUD11]WAT18475.1 hypothetical protein OZN62_02525 [Aurantiacibacter sp. MUD11]
MRFSALPMATVLLAACASYPEPPAVTASGEVPDAWYPVDATSGQITDVAGLEALVEAFPNSSSVRLRLLNALLAAEDLPRALQVAESLAAHGYAFSPAAREYLRGQIEGEAPAWLAANAQIAASLATSEVVATIPAEARLPESLAVKADGSFLVTTVVSRELWSNSGGEWEEQSLPLAGNLSGVRLGQRVVVVASGNLGMLGEGEAFASGIFARQSGNQYSLHRAPEGVQFSDIAVGDDATLYASDPLGGGVYSSPIEGLRFLQLVPPGVLRSPQGIAPSGDGSRLYISDYRYGLAMIDLESGEVSRLAADIPVLLDGIDGLWLHEGELIAVQNGVNPMRIVALRLSEDGNRIIGVRTLERANPEWTEPLGGDIHEGALYYIGNGSWDLFEEGGVLREGSELRETHIRRLELAEKPTD